MNTVSRWRREVQLLRMGSIWLKCPCPSLGLGFGSGIMNGDKRRGEENSIPKAHACRNADCTYELAPNDPHTCLLGLILGA